MKSGAITEKKQNYHLTKGTHKSAGRKNNSALSGLELKSEILKTKHFEDSEIYS